MRQITPPPERTFVDFIRAEAGLTRYPRAERPATEEGWRRRLDGVRRGLERSFGRRPDAPCDLAPEILGTIRRDGYAIERLTFQSRPGVRVTANLYRPDPAPAPCPAVLSVHGHWKWARIDPVVQARAIGLAKLGYVVLGVDAFGAGERAIDPGPGTYHGGLVGASLWPAGVPLLGLQVYDNRRAVDYLLTRPEVDPARLAITGASGGGNQTLYAGATDERLRAVVPVCGIGTYESYLGTGCCICEMNVAGLTYAGTGDLLAMMAPRALLVISATKDAVQFSVAEAARSVEWARGRYEALGAPDRLKHLPVESGHDYNRPMREAMYGWLDRWLRDKGDGSPVPEPEIQTEDPQLLRCYPDGPSRPKSIVTIPEFALNEGRARLAALPRIPDHRERWEAEEAHLRAALRPINGVPRVHDMKGAGPSNPHDMVRIGAGGVMHGRLFRPDDGRSETTTLLLRHEGRATRDDPLVAALLASGRAVATVELRATGEAKPKTPVIAGVADHNEAQWALWVGFPLLSQWVWDVDGWGSDLMMNPNLGAERRPESLELVGVGPFGLVAILAATLGMLSNRVARVGWIDPLVSFVGPDASPWAKLPMGLIAPNILDVADVGQVAALVAPRPLVLAGGVEPTGAPASPERRDACWAFARSVYRVLDAGERLTLLDSSDPSAFARALAAS